MAAYGTPQSMMYNTGYGRLGNSFRDRSAEQSLIGNATANPAVLPQFNGGIAPNPQQQQFFNPTQSNNAQVMQAQGGGGWSGNPIRQAPQQMQAMNGQLQSQQAPVPQQGGYTNGQLILNKYYGVPLPQLPGQSPQMQAPQGGVPQGPVQSMPTQQSPYMPRWNAQPVAQPPTTQPVQQPQGRGFIPGFM